jgi:hypothetical protein
MQDMGQTYERKGSQKKMRGWIPLPKLGPGSFRFEQIKSKNSKKQQKKDRNIINANICAFGLKYASAFLPALGFEGNERWRPGDTYPFC